MKKTEFLTTKGLKSPRPDWAKTGFKIFFWVTSSIAIVLNTVTTIDPALKGHINEWCIAGNLIADGLSHTFGVVTK